MKRLATIILLLLTVANISNCKKEENAVNIKGYINFVAGNVKLISVDGTSKKAKIGDELVQGMKIETIGERSFVDIYIGEYIIKVLGNAIVDITKLLHNISSENNEIRFTIERGKIFTRITKKLVKGDVCEVITPTATAGVRGTEFLVSEEKGKSNIACLSGMVSVLNNTTPDSNPIILNPKEEADIIPGKDPIKKEISIVKLEMLEILLEIKEMREEIKKKFEEHREEIRKHVIKQKSKNREILDAQMQKDKDLVDDQKKGDKENIKNIKSITNDAANKAIETAKKQMDSVKVDKESVRKKAEEKIKSVKPKINKKKINKDQFKKNE